MIVRFPFSRRLVEQTPPLPAAAGSSSDEVDDPLRQWIAEARAGSPEALNKLLTACRGYLLGIANGDLESGIRTKMGASDIVQETLLEAEQGMHAFRGVSEAELLAWLRQILHNNLLDARRYTQADKRRIDREQRLDATSSGPMYELADTSETPSALLSEQEDQRRLMQAMARLPADDRQVIELRNWQLLSFAQIGERMERSEEAARKLWSRAIMRLQQQMGEANER